MLETGFLIEVLDFFMASILSYFFMASILSKSVTLTGLRTPSRDALKIEFAIHCRVADVLLAQNHHLFLQSCAKEVKAATPGWVTSSI